MFKRLKKKAIQSIAAGSVIRIVIGAVMMAFAAVPAFRSHPVSILLFFGGLGLILWGVIRILRTAMGATLKGLKHTISAAGYTEAAVEADYAAAACFEKSEDIRIGQLFLYYRKGAVPGAIPNDKILWAYQSTTTHRSNGIKTGSSYNLILYREDAENCIILPVPDENTAREMLRAIDETMPWVVVGYTDDLKKMFLKHRDRFLELRYHQMPHGNKTGKTDSSAAESAPETGNNG